MLVQFFLDHAYHVHHLWKLDPYESSSVTDDNNDRSEQIRNQSDQAAH